MCEKRLKGENCTDYAAKAEHSSPGKALQYAKLHVLSLSYSRHKSLQWRSHVMVCIYLSISSAWCLLKALSQLSSPNSFISIRLIVCGCTDCLHWLAQLRHDHHAIHVNMYLYVYVCTYASPCQGYHIVEYSTWPFKCQAACHSMYALCHYLTTVLICPSTYRGGMGVGNSTPSRTFLHALAGRRCAHKCTHTYSHTPTPTHRHTRI